MLPGEYIAKSTATSNKKGSRNLYIELRQRKIAPEVGFPARQLGELPTPPPPV